MRCRGGDCADCRFKRTMLDNRCYRSVTSILLLGNVAGNPVQEFVMRSTSLLTPLLALVLAACSPSNGSGKKSGGPPGIGMPPPELSAVTVEARAPALRFAD